VSRRRSHVGVQIGIANLGHHRGIETGCLPHIKRWLKSIMWAQGKRDIIVVKWLLTLGISVGADRPCVCRSIPEFVDSVA